MIKKKHVFVAALLSGFSLYADDQQTVQEQVNTALVRADEVVVQAGEKVGDVMQKIADTAESVVETAVDTVHEIAENIKKNEEEQEEDAKDDRTMPSEVAEIYRMLDEVLDCFRGVQKHLRENTLLSQEQAAELQKYTSSEEVMNAALIYALQRGEIDLGVMMLDFVRAEAFTKGAARHTRALSDDTSEDSWDWSSDEDSDDGDGEFVGDIDTRFQKFVFGTTILVAGFIALSAYYHWFEQPDMSGLNLD